MRHRETIVGVILAGGRSRRMGGRDKALLPLRGEPMASRTAHVLSAHCRACVLVSNADPGHFAALGLPVIKDEFGDYAGPLAGLLSAMRWAKRNVPGVRWILTAPCDTPFLPDDYVLALAGAGLADTDDNAIVIAGSEGQRHFACGLWPVSLEDDLAAWLEGGGHRMQGWIERHPNRTVAFPTVRLGERRIDPFFNVNTPEDYALAQKIIQETPS